MLQGLLTVRLTGLGLLSRPKHLCSGGCWCSRPASSLCLHLPEHCHASAGMHSSQPTSCSQNGETRMEDDQAYAHVFAKESGRQLAREHCWCEKMPHSLLTCSLGNAPTSLHGLAFHRHGSKASSRAFPCQLCSKGSASSTVAFKESFVPAASVGTAAGQFAASTGAARAETDLVPGSPGGLSACSECWAGLTGQVGQIRAPAAPGQDPGAGLEPFLQRSLHPSPCSAACSAHRPAIVRTHFATICNSS